MMYFYSTLKLAMFGGYLAALNLWIGISQTNPTVDVELVLAVDISGSMDNARLQMQRSGYVSAFRNEEFIQEVKSGPTGRIAVAYMEWAGPGYQNIVVPRTVIERPEDALYFANVLATKPVGHPFNASWGTSISGALLGAASLMEPLGVSGARRVIDISGDGENNSGIALEPVRQALIAQGVTINGLPISIKSTHPFDYWGPDPSQLQEYFENCVIGGDNSFSLVVSETNQFETTLRKKLKSEIVAQRLRPIFANATMSKPKSYDCRGPGERPGR